MTDYTPPSADAPHLLHGHVIIRDPILDEKLGGYPPLNEKSLDELLAEDQADRHEQLAGSNIASTVSSLANELGAAHRRKTELEAELKETTETIRRYEDKLLPEAMDVLQVREWTTSDGQKVAIKDVVQASLPKEEDDADLRDKGLDWLEENELGGVIKLSLKLELPKGDLVLASEVIEALQKVLKRVGLPAPRLRRDVHPQTLTATVRDLLEKGIAVPVEPFKLYQGRTVKITPAGAASARKGKKGKTS